MATHATKFTDKEDLLKEVSKEVNKCQKELKEIKTMFSKYRSEVAGVLNDYGQYEATKNALEKNKNSPPN